MGTQERDAEGHLPRVAEVLKGRSICITGVTGYLGSLLLRHIADQAPDVESCYVLVRAKGAKMSAQQRFQKEVLGMALFSDPKFGDVRALRAWVASKVVVVEGDVSMHHLGISQALWDEMQRRVQVMLHIAATPNFYSPIDDAVQANTLGAVRVAEFAAGCSKLLLHLHYSTCFVHSDGGAGPMGEAEMAWGRSPAALRGDKAGWFDVEEEVAWAQSVRTDMAAAWQRLERHGKVHLGGHHGDGPSDGAGSDGEGSGSDATDASPDLVATLSDDLAADKDQARAGGTAYGDGAAAAAHNGGGTNASQPSPGATGATGSGNMGAWLYSWVDSAIQWAYWAVGWTQPAPEASAKKELRKKLKELGRARARQLGWQDVYTYTKAMAEMLVVRLAAEHELPLVIMRPAIVASTYTGHLRGWHHGWAEAAPILAGLAAAHIPAFPSTGELDIIPADAIVAATLAAVAKHAVAADPTAPGARGAPPAIYQVASHDSKPLAVSHLMHLGEMYMASRNWPVRLEDGSLMDLNSDARIAARLEAWRQQRAVQPQAGQAAHSAQPMQQYGPIFLGTMSKAGFDAWIAKQYVAPYEQVGPGSWPADRVAKLVGSIHSKVYTYVGGLYERYTVPLRPYAFQSDNSRALLKARHPDDVAALPFDWDAFDWDAYLMEVHFPLAMEGHLNNYLSLYFSNFMNRMQRLQLQLATAAWAVEYAKAAAVRTLWSS